MNDNGIDKFQWPSQSSDLKPMENRSGVLTRIFYREGRQFNSVNALRKAIIDVWTEISLEVLQNVSTIFKCILAKGANTKYKLFLE